MPQLRLVTNGERVRSFLSLRVKEIDRQIERGKVALQTVKDDLERSIKQNQEQFQRVQEYAGRQNQGMSAMGGGGLGNQFGLNGEVGNVFQFRGQIGRIENQIAELSYRRSHVVWLSEQFEHDKQYELDAPDLQLLGMTPLVLGGGQFAYGGSDAFELTSLC